MVTANSHHRVADPSVSVVEYENQAVVDIFPIDAVFHYLAAAAQYCAMPLAFRRFA